MKQLRYEIKFKDSASDVLEKLNDNLAQVNELLAENRRLLKQFIKTSLEVVNLPLEKDDE